MQQSNFFTWQSNAWWCTTKQVRLQKDQHLRRHGKKVIFWSYEPLLWPWLSRQWTNFSAWYSGSWCCITTPCLVAKFSVVQKISPGQTFNNILNLCCNLDLESSNPIFPQDTPAYDAVLPNQVWLQRDQQFRRYSIFWLHKPLLWLSHWRQWANFSARHSGLWCCITIPRLTTKCSVV